LDVSLDAFRLLDLESLVLLVAVEDALETGIVTRETGALPQCAGFLAVGFRCVAAGTLLLLVVAPPVGRAGLAVSLARERVLKTMSVDKL
jgi:hypothetical protein